MCVYMFSGYSIYFPPEIKAEKNNKSLSTNRVNVSSPVLSDFFSNVKPCK